MRRILLSLACALGAAGAIPGTAAAVVGFTPCAEGGWKCGTVTVPLDYSNPGGPTAKIAVTRLRATDGAHRLGSLFINFGGPGAGSNDLLQAFGADLFAGLTDRYDLVGFDPRGTGTSSNPIDCKVDQETVGLYSKPFLTPVNFDQSAWLAKAHAFVDACVANNDPSTLPHINTANAARDMDSIRATMGEKRLNYFGFSYGTYLGATYATLFPKNYKRMVLDGGFDPDQYANDPTAGLEDQSAAFEYGLNRFFQACARQPDACGFGDGDPWDAFDQIVDSLNEHPQPASADDPRLVTGDDVLAGVVGTAIYAKQNWSFAAEVLAQAAGGDYSGIRLLADFFYAPIGDGTYDPFTDRYFAIGAADQRYADRQPGSFVRSGRSAWSKLPHSYWNTGYVELPYSLWPFEQKNAFYGPFKIPSSSYTVLQVGTTYDPATPYRSGKLEAAQLANVRFLTMRGDGHTAYGGNSPCIDAAVDAYMLDGTLPPAGKSCKQEVEAFPSASARGVARARTHLVWRPGSRFP